MYKLISKLMLVSFVFYPLSAALAQTISFQPPQPVTASKNYSTASTHRVLSADEYRKKVGASTQQNQSVINQQVENNLSKVAPVAPAPRADLMPSEAPASSTNEFKAQSISPIQPAPQGTVIPATTSTVPQPGTAPTLPKTPQQPTSTSIPAGQPQQRVPVYTGFQAPPASGTGTTQQPKSSSGWNIKY